MNTNWAIFWIVIYPMDSAVHPVSTNWGLVDYSKFLCSSARMLQLNSNAFCDENILHEYWLFGVDSSRLHLMFVTVCLLSVVPKQ